MTSQPAISAQESTVDQVTQTTGEAVNAVTSWWDNPVTQEWLIAKPVTILIILVVAGLAHWALRRFVERLARKNIHGGGRPLKISRALSRRGRVEEEISEQVQAMRDSQEQRRQSRVRTLAGVFKSASAILIWTFAVLAILSEIGVNIAPLIASAGVVGVALGFGAQSLVKDFLSGIFMLMEDQYGVGDTVDVGDGIIGDVEDISLRITTVRDIDGTLWYVRNGEILRVGNLSDEYAIARIQIPVGLSNDTGEAWKVILDTAQATAQDPAIRNVILEEPTMNGVTAVEPDHLSYRVSVKTLPGEQWGVQRLIQAKIVDALRANDISMPYPRGIGALRPAEYQQAQSQ